jgi:hypothetical protein
MRRKRRKKRFQTIRRDADGRGRRGLSNSAAAVAGAVGDERALKNSVQQGLCSSFTAAATELAAIKGNLDGKPAGEVAGASAHEHRAIDAAFEGR